ncbi:MAG: hypothetical protein IPM36_15280 [Lewinellaceae bacterium]|jgi:hypothetical protein|nr:hypothetical protein [Lewinellaceae bacterium]
MKMHHFLFILLLSMTPFALTAQSMVGSWTYQATTPDGAEVTNTMIMNEDGTFTVDFASDGKAEVLGTYTIEGSKITIRDTPEESPCYGKDGVYNFQLEGDALTITLIEDACEIRRRDRPWTITRKK